MTGLIERRLFSFYSLEGEEEMGKIIFCRDLSETTVNVMGGSPINIDIDTTNNIYIAKLFYYFNLITSSSATMIYECCINSIDIGSHVRITNDYTMGFRDAVITGNNAIKLCNQGTYIQLEKESVYTGANFGTKAMLMITEYEKL